MNKLVLVQTYFVPFSLLVIEPKNIFFLNFIKNHYKIELRKIQIMIWLLKERTRRFSYELLTD